MDNLAPYSFFDAVAYFGTTPQLWQNLQKAFELRVAEIESGTRIEARVQPRETTQVGGG